MLLHTSDHVIISSEINNFELLYMYSIYISYERCSIRTVTRQGPKRSDVMESVELTLIHQYPHPTLLPSCYVLHVLYTNLIYYNS